MRIVYVAMIDERHSDPEPYVFTAADAAITFAREQAYEWARAPEDVEEEPIKGWLYNVRWSHEGDSAWVVEKVLNEEG